jgi:hypothetical protein
LSHRQLRTSFRLFLVDGHKSRNLVLGLIRRSYVGAAAAAGGGGGAAAAALTATPTTFTIDLTSIYASVLLLLLLLLLSSSPLLLEVLTLFCMLLSRPCLCLRHCCLHRRIFASEGRRRQRRR